MGSSSDRVAARPPLPLIGGHVAIDLLNTHAVPGGAVVEWLANGADLKAWLGVAGMAVPRATARDWDSTAADVRRLREAFRRFVDRHSGHPLRPTDAGGLAEVNAILATDNAYRQVAAGDIQSAGQPLVWQRRRRPVRPGTAVLLLLADAIGELVITADFTLIRRCEGAACTLQFLDQTKSHARRWCSMAGCGNRAKAAAHRTRRRAER